MRTCRHVLLLLMVAGFVPQAQGRLGETISQCEQRYGKPHSTRVDDKDIIAQYTKQQFVVKIVFNRGKAVEIYYSRASGEPLTEADILLFLDANAGDSHWTKVDQVEEWKRANRGHEDDEERQRALMQDLAAFFLYTREDGGAEASYDRQDAVLLICSAERLDRENQNDRKTPESPLGF
jgi:hypothetical protein